MSKIFDERVANQTVKAPLGFTRIDLLAVTLVLGVLACLNLAAVSNNRSGSQGAVCMANLRDLTQGWQQFAIDQGRFPPNSDDGNISPGYEWVGGNVAVGGAQQFNPDIVSDPLHSLLFSYLRHQDPSVFRCPADLRQGRYQGADPLKQNLIVPIARSYCMNGAVGTDPYIPSNFELPVNGPWLDNNHGHVRGLTWRTYGRFSDIVAPAPDKLMILIDEDGASINDAVFSFGMEADQWIDWPATRHIMGGTLSFADGHVELRRWVDPSTTVLNFNPSVRAVPGSPDYTWLKERISARIRP